MELSYFLGQLLGLSLAIFSALGILRPRIVTDAVEDFKAGGSFLTLIFGFIGIVVGLAIILSHNVWEASWRVMITIVGWAALLKGVAYLIAPDSLLSIGRKVYKNKVNTRVILIIGLLLGLYLARMGSGY